MTSSAIAASTNPEISVLQSVVILPENRILLGATHTKFLAPRLVRDGVADSPVLAVYNLDQVPKPASRRRQPRRTPTVLFALEFVRGRGVALGDMFLRYHINAHSYSSEVAVPFFGSPADDIVLLHSVLSPDSQHIASPYTFHFPISTLLRHVGTANNRQPKTRHIQWDDWGATVIRKTYRSFPLPDRNPLSGTRFLPCPSTRKGIHVWDFGRARVMQLQTSDSESVPFVQEVALPTEDVKH